MEFNIGERVRVKDYKNLPEQMKVGGGMAKIAGKDGEIVDKLWSGAKGCMVYRIHIDGYPKVSAVDFPEESFDLISELEKKAYRYEIDVLDNVVVAVLYEVGDDFKTEIARGHGHIIHEGEVGVAQAASYALKKIYQKFSNVYQ
jgi:hypothetical protein